MPCELAFARKGLFHEELYHVCRHRRCHASRNGSAHLCTRRERTASTPRQLVPTRSLVAFEATGGYERLLVADLLEAGHLDAAVIARSGQQVKPRPLAEVHEKQGELDQIVTRRRQLVDLCTTGKNRFAMAHSKPFKRSLQLLIDTINKEIKRIEKAILVLVESDVQWRGKSEVMSSVPGVGQVTTATLIAEFPELGQINRQQVAALSGLAPFNRDSEKFKGKRTISGGSLAVVARSW